MTHASFPAPAVHAAALAVHTRLRAQADENGIGTVSPAMLHGSGDLARFAAAAGEGTVHLSLDDLGLIATDMPPPPTAAS